MRLILRQCLPVANAIIAFPLTFGITGAREDKFTDCRQQVAAEIDKLQVSPV